MKIAIILMCLINLVHADLIVTINDKNKTAYVLRCDTSDRCMSASAVAELDSVYDIDRDRQIKGSNKHATIKDPITYCVLVDKMHLWSKRCYDEKLMIGEKQ